MQARAPRAQTGAPHQRLPHRACKAALASVPPGADPAGRCSQVAACWTSPMAAPTLPAPAAPLHRCRWLTMTPPPPPPTRQRRVATPSTRTRHLRQGYHRTTRHSARRTTQACQRTSLRRRKATRPRILTTSPWTCQASSRALQSLRRSPQTIPRRGPRPSLCPLRVSRPRRSHLQNLRRQRDRRFHPNQP